VECHKVLTSEALMAVSCVCGLKNLRNKNVFSLNFLKDIELLPITYARSELPSTFNPLPSAFDWFTS